MSPFDGGLIAALSLAVPNINVAASDARENVAVVAIAVTTPSVSKYNPDMVERVLRAKNGPLVEAPSGDAAFMEWLLGS